MKRYKQARRRCEQVVRDFFKNVSWLDTVFVHEDNPKRMSHLDYMLYHFEEEFYHDYELKRNATLRLMPLFCRLAFECGFQQSNPKPQKLLFLKRVLELLLKKSNDGVINLSDIDIYNTSYDDLEKEYETHIEKRNELTRLVVENGQWVRNEDYEIIEDVNYKMAHEYADYCSLCYLQSFATWNNYANYGTSKVYLILHKDWKNVEKKHDDESTNSPYDTYGRSMIFVFVDSEGNLAYCNTRWNHDATYDTKHSTDHALDEKEISEIVGVNFYEVFKPKAKKLEDDPVYRLSKGDDIDDIFDSVVQWVNGLRVVGLNRRFNVLNEKNELISPGRWFKHIENMTKDGQIIVRTFDNFVTILNRDGTYLLDYYYSNIMLHECGSYYVAWNSKNENKYIINKNGKIVSSYDRTKAVLTMGLCDSNGVMTNNYMVQTNFPIQGFSIYSEDGRLIFKTTYKDRTIRNNGWIKFLDYDGIFYHVSGDGKILGKSNEFKDILYFNFSKGWMLVGETKSGGRVVLNDRLERISDEYPIIFNCYGFDDRYLAVVDKGHCPQELNFIDKHGKLLLPRNTVFVPLFIPKYYTNEYAVVQTEDPKFTDLLRKGNAFLKSDGTIIRLNEKWAIIACYDKFAVVVKYKLDKVLTNAEENNLMRLHPEMFHCNLIDNEGNLLLDEWCENIEGFGKILLLRTSTDKQVLTTDLKPFFVDDIKLTQFDKIYFDYNVGGGIYVVRDGKCAYFDEKGRWMFDKMWFDEMVSLISTQAVTNYVGDKLYKLCPNGKVKEVKE